MDTAYLHLYVKKAAVWRDWFINNLNFRPLSQNPEKSLGEFAVRGAQISILISSEQAGDPDVKQFLQTYAEGVADVAFRVKDLAMTVAQVTQAGGQVLRPIQYQEGPEGVFRWCRVKGWGSLSHTLIEPLHGNPQPFGEIITASPLKLPVFKDQPSAPSLSQPDIPWVGIDHVVMNVSAGTLDQAIAWYQRQFGFIPQQQFKIATSYSGLRSFVLKHPKGNATLPVNEPTSKNSQVQEFLDLHRGAGIQHAALETQDLVKTVATLRRRQIPFLAVPSTYYQQLRKRSGFWAEADDWAAIAEQQILVDWPTNSPQTRLLQTFTRPLFEQPTFFLELIERQTKPTPTGTRRPEGFGEGNFQALFEAIEREQQQRGSL